MRCINTALLLLSLSFVVSIPIKTTSSEVPLLANSTEEEIIVFPKEDLPIEEVVVVVKKPEESNETFTGPPKIDIRRKLLEKTEEHKAISTIDVPEVIVVEDNLTDKDVEELEEEDNSENSGRRLLSIDDEIVMLRPGSKPAPIPPNSPAGKAMARLSKKKLVDDDEDENENEEIEEEDSDDESTTNSRRLLRKRFKKVVKKVAKQVKKIFHHKKGGSPQASHPAPATKATGWDGLKQHRAEKTKGLTGAARNAINANEKKFETWLKTDVGKDAADFCISLGILNKPRVFNGCLEDMMVTRNKHIAKEAAITAEEFLAKDQVSTSRKFCTASGDPHFTNYDGAYFHLQEPGVYTLAKVDNFEVQEKVKKHGPNRPGVPSCLIGVSVKLGGVSIEADVNNYGSVRINGMETTLPRDYTVSVGGLKVRYGNQVVEWKGLSSRRTGLKFMTKDGFGVMIEGGYCGVVEVNVPEKYFGRMTGICGNADNRRDAGDFKAPDGKVMNVRYGTRSWEMSGYGGPSAPLSRWQLAWKPTGPDCKFKEGCEQDSPAVAQARAREAERIRKLEDEKRKVEEAARKAERDAREAKKRAEREKRRAEREKKKKEREQKLAEAKKLEEEAKKKEEIAKQKEEAAKKERELIAKKEKEALERERKRIAEEARKKAIEEANAAAKIVISSDKSVSRSSRSSKKSRSSKSSKKSRSKGKSKKHLKKRNLDEEKIKNKTKKIIKELESGRGLSTSKLNKISESISKIIDEAKNKEVNELKSVMDNIESSKVDVNDIYKKYTSKLSKVKSIRKRINILKKTIKKHFSQMKADTTYLQRLELVKPKFLKTLDKYNRQVASIRRIIKKHIIEGNDKDVMLGFLDEADKHTQTSTGKLSKAFLEHYEKYKNMIGNEKTTYSSELKELSMQTDLLNTERKDKNTLWKQYKRALNVLNRLKKTYALSKQDAQDFNQLSMIIKAIFRNPKKINKFLRGNVDEKCATTLLQSHADNLL